MIPASSLSVINQSVCDIINIESESDALEISEIPTMQVLSDSILENSEFQDSLVQNISRILQLPDQYIESQKNQDESAMQADKCNRKQIYSSTPIKSDNVNLECISIKQRLRPRKQPVDEPKPTLPFASNSSKRRKTTNKTSSDRDFHSIDFKSTRPSEKHFDIPATGSEAFVCDANMGMQTVQSLLFDPTRSTSTGDCLAVDSTNVVLNNTVDANQLEPGSVINFDECIIKKRQILPSNASDINGELTEVDKNNYIDMPKSRQMKSQPAPLGPLVSKPNIKTNDKEEAFKERKSLRSIKSGEWESFYRKHISGLNEKENEYKRAPTKKGRKMAENSRSLQIQ